MPLLDRFHPDVLTTLMRGQQRRPRGRHPHSRAVLANGQPAWSAVRWPESWDSAATDAPSVCLSGLAAAVPALSARPFPEDKI